MKYSATLVFLTIAVCAMALSPDDYFPMAIGNSWTSQDSSADGIDTSTASITDTATILGYESFLYIDEGDEEGDSIYFQMRPTGLHQIIFSEGANIEMFVLPASFDIGDDWTMMEVDSTWTETGLDYYLQMNMFATALELENCNIPAGMFSNCLKLGNNGIWKINVLMGTDTVYSDMSTFGSYMWIAEDVGPVKDISWDIIEGDTIWTSSALLEYNFANIDEEIIRPDDVSIFAWPNPFNSACMIATPIGAEVEIFDVTGRLVETLPASEEIVHSWTPSADEPGGVYLVHATVGEEKITSKVLLVK